MPSTEFSGTAFFTLFYESSYFLEEAALLAALEEALDALEEAVLLTAAEETGAAAEAAEAVLEGAV